MSDREIMNAKKPPSAREILEEEYPTIYYGYKEIQDEQFELFAKKHLDYGMHNVSAGTNLDTDDEVEFAMTGLWYRLSDKINRWKNMIISGRKAQNETLIDTFQDVTNYGIIAQLVSRGMWKNDLMPKKLKGVVKKVWESKIKQQPSKNAHISYSSLSTYSKCPKLWELMYLRNQVPFTQNIYTCFGTAMHETMQEWLTVMYHDTVKSANNIDLDKLLYANMVKAYKQGRAQMKGDHFSSSDELTQFWLDGKHILDFLKKKRGGYFSTKTMMLAGVETLLYQDIKPGVKFKGLVDLVFYHPTVDEWTIMDIKTSTSGWREHQKKNPNLTAQVVLYKEFFSRQFDIPKEKINVEFFIVKRRVPAEAEFASMQRRVQEFRPNAGPRKTKQVLTSMNNFIEDVLDQNGKYIDKEYPCKSPLGKCSECSNYY